MPVVQAWGRYPIQELYLSYCLLTTRSEAAGAVPLAAQAVRADSGVAGVAGAWAPAPAQVVQEGSGVAGVVQAPPAAAQVVREVMVL